MIVAIESSCDDSAIALVEIDTFKIHFHRKISQSEHCAFGGVVPELASRLHALNLPKILDLIKDDLHMVKAVAVTNEPGLTVSLSGGVIMAQALSLALNVPLICVNHLKGHICSLFIEKEATFPLAILLVSGGHTMALEAGGYGSIRSIGSTIDDSLGEAFDKVAKMLGLGYPGGAVIEQLAKDGDAFAYDYPLPLRGEREVRFSYSGLKNSVRLSIENALNPIRSNVAASFQRVAVEHLLSKFEIYLKTSKVKHIGLVGGVSANGYLRDLFVKLCDKYQKTPLFAPLEFCSDNAAMIARASVEEFKAGRFIDPAQIEIRSRVEFKG